MAFRCCVVERAQVHDDEASLVVPLEIDALRPRAHHDTLPHAHERLQHELLDLLPLACRLVHAVEQHDQRAQPVGQVQRTALLARELVVDPAEQRVGLGEMLCELLHGHQHRQQRHAGVLFCVEERSADGVRELLHAPRLARAGVGADQHALRLVRALRSRGGWRQQQLRQLRHLVDGAPASSRRTPSSPVPVAPSPLCVVM